MYRTFPVKSCTYHCWIRRSNGVFSTRSVPFVGEECALFARSSTTVRIDLPFTM